GSPMRSSITQIWATAKAIRSSRVSSSSCPARCITGTDETASPKKPNEQPTPETTKRSGNKKPRQGGATLMATSSVTAAIVDQAEARIDQAEAGVDQTETTSMISAAMRLPSAADSWNERISLKFR